MPVSILGWVVTALMVATAVYLFIDIDRSSHSVSDTLINFVFQASVLAALYTLVALFTSRKSAD